jgi:hypothetical protein
LNIALAINPGFRRGLQVPGLRHEAHGRRRVVASRLRKNPTSAFSLSGMDIRFRCRARPRAPRARTPYRSRSGPCRLTFLANMVYAASMKITYIILFCRPGHSVRRQAVSG